MASLDPNYVFVTSGSTATSAATAHNIFGLYSALSQLSASEVLLIQVSASVGDMMLSPGPATQATNNIGIPIFTSDAILTLPPIINSSASQITFARLTATNSTAVWTIWRRAP